MKFRDIDEAILDGVKEKLGWMSPVEYRLTHLAA